MMKAEIQTMTASNIRNEKKKKEDEDGVRCTKIVIVGRKEKREKEKESKVFSMEDSPYENASCLLLSPLCCMISSFMPLSRHALLCMSMLFILSVGYVGVSFRRRSK